MRARAAWVLLLGGLSMLSGCATTYDLTSSTRTPAASGTLKVSAGDNGNSHLSVQVENLAEPSKISPDAVAYVAWVSPPSGGPAQNAGSLTVHGNDLSGSLSTLTPLHRFKLFLTPERLPQATSPTGPEVLSVTAHQ